jgi:SET domain-containing protein
VGWHAGELIRPEVLEVRERQLYNNLLGSGTYTFKLACGSGMMCVDASQQGNMAHLINHSCDPNCFSATKSIFASSGMQEHVIIIAQRNIEVGTELTYNYRCSPLSPASAKAALCSLSV